MLIRNQLLTLKNFHSWLYVAWFQFLLRYRKTLLRPARGRIRLDGAALGQWSPDSLSQLGTVSGEHVSPDGIFLPQITWLRSRPTSTDLIVDYVGRVETLARDLHNLSSVLLPSKAGISLKASHRNRSTGTAPSVLTSSNVIDTIVEKYHEDFEVFDYSKEPSKAVPTHD